MKPKHIKLSSLLALIASIGVLSLVLCMFRSSRHRVEEVVKNTNVDLFGIEMVGTPQSILEKLDNSKYLSLDTGPDGFQHENGNNFSCRVLMDGIAFGMTIMYDGNKPEKTVEGVTFITSNTDDRIIKTIVKNLMEYYGKPAIEDYEEAYTWFPNGHFLKARPYHGEEGGWTFYICD